MAAAPHDAAPHDAARPDLGDQAYFHGLGAGRFRPTHHAQGAWNADEQHLSPVAGLLAHSLQCHDPRPDLQLARIGYDVLGGIPMTELTVQVRAARPGRTIELLEAVARAGERTV